MPVRRDIERNQEIVAAFNDGMKAADIAREFGLSRERIRQILVRNGSQTKHALDEKFDVGALYREYIAGKTLSVLADEIGISEKSLSSIFQKHNMERRKSAPIIKQTFEKVSAMHRDYMSGMNQAQVAEKYRIPQTWVSWLFIKYGLPRRKKGTRR